MSRRRAHRRRRKQEADFEWRRALKEETGQARTQEGPQKDAEEAPQQDEATEEAPQEEAPQEQAAQAGNVITHAKQEATQWEEAPLEAYKRPVFPEIRLVSGQERVVYRVPPPEAEEEAPQEEAPQGQAAQADAQKDTQEAALNEETVPAITQEAPQEDTEEAPKEAPQEGGGGLAWVFVSYY